MKPKINIKGEMGEVARKKLVFNPRNIFWTKKIGWMIASPLLYKILV
jgi:bacteriorhodopsin